MHKAFQINGWEAFSRQKTKQASTSAQTSFNFGNKKARHHVPGLMILVAALQLYLFFISY
jgi:hypothetical protein